MSSLQNFQSLVLVAWTFDLGSAEVSRDVRGVLGPVSPDVGVLSPSLSLSSTSVLHGACSSGTMPVSTRTSLHSIARSWPVSDLARIEKARRVRTIHQGTVEVFSASEFPLYVQCIGSHESEAEPTS